MEYLDVKESDELNWETAVIVMAEEMENDLILWPPYH
jgi:hypothetical protein